MKHSFITPIVVLFSCFVFGQNQSTFRADRDTVAEQEIKSLEFLLVDLIAKGDIDTYSGYLTDDYIRVNANGIVSTKDQVLEIFRKAKGQSPGKMMPHDLVVRVYGTTAILRGVLDIETKNGDAIVKKTSIITKVFLKRNDKWYMTSMQGTAAQ
ncbi:MAG TPA: nuclear transport factor 2 family protein [Chitinophagaceae bacterium]|nr:nuclear transport factor 2 family protein [Chitinophagaceae bacterium]